MKIKNFKVKNEEAVISYNGKSLKKIINNVNEVVDTVLLSVKVDKKSIISEIVNESFYQFTGIEEDRKANYDEKNYGFEQFTYVGLERLLTIRKSFKNYGNNFVTIRIASLHKLTELIGLNIDNKVYGEEIVKKIIFKIFSIDIKSSHVKLKELQPAIDLEFDKNISEEDFFNMSHRLTIVIANLYVRYRIPEFKNFLSTGYFLNRRGEKKIRFYNKSNKENDSKLTNIYRIEYIFDRKEIKNKLLIKHNRLDNLSKQSVLNYISSDFAGILRRNNDSYLNLNSSKRIHDKYIFYVTGEAIGSNRWKENVKTSTLISGSKKPLFDGKSSYYRNKKSMNWSFFSLMQNEANLLLLKMMIDLFDNNYFRLKQHKV